MHLRGVFVGDEDGKAIGNELPAEYASECPLAQQPYKKKTLTHEKSKVESFSGY